MKNLKYLLKALVLFLFFSLVFFGCGVDSIDVTLPLPDPNIEIIVDAGACSVESVPGGSLISCPDGSLSVLLDGSNGVDGVDGSNGVDGTDATVTVTVFTFPNEVDCKVLAVNTSARRTDDEKIKIWNTEICSGSKLTTLRSDKNEAFWLDDGSLVFAEGKEDETTLRKIKF